MLAVGQTWMSSEFVAKFGGKPCVQCLQIVVKGQRVRYFGYTKQLVHSPTCPPKLVQKVFFRHSCGCIIGDCTHGEDARHEQL